MMSSGPASASRKPPCSTARRCCGLRFSRRAPATGPNGFRIEPPQVAVLESMRTECGLNHDSPFVRNFAGDIAGAGLIVINHETKRLSLAALERTPARARWLHVESISRSRSLMEHDLFGKPVPTFPDHALAVRNIGGANEEVRFGVTVRCGCRNHATDPCGQGRWTAALRQGYEGVCMRQAARSHVAMLQCPGEVRLFRRPPRLQTLTTPAAREAGR
jgi:hypothetical protein